MIPRRPLELSFSLVKLALIFLLTSLAFAQQPAETLRARARSVDSVSASGVIDSVGAVPALRRDPIGASKRKLPGTKVE